MAKFEQVLVTGGAGYVGAVLVPRLLSEGYRVRVLDLYIYGKEPLEGVRSHPNLEEIQADIRNLEAVKAALRDCDAVIHLACISNDPSVELDPALSRSINCDAFGPLVAAAKQSGVRRFLFASSGSVYGVSDAPEVTEDHLLVPVSLYNQYKAFCEPVLLEQQGRDFTAVIVRPATICGYSPRQRLDLTVNILTSQAVCAERITVFGGAQMRPNLHIQDMVDLYAMLLEVPDHLVTGRIFNAGYQNYSVAEIARMVRSVVMAKMPERADVPLVTTRSDDVRSYRISSERIKRELGFVPKHTVEEGAGDLVDAFLAGKLPNAMTDDRYYNIKRMKSIHLV